ncbi:unnamed protein product [Phytophthora fragariaefolia]|uniref:Unnamed protein product n=1 Tax=Phytophthora fragariaefolia TaxID=1490495 RepID=A0A9W6WZQ4_9STRA|nr:unnamed protein product [Phytophthora fragariaefolia]
MDDPSTTVHDKNYPKRLIATSSHVTDEHLSSESVEAIDGTPSVHQLFPIDLLLTSCRFATIERSRRNLAPEFDGLDESEAVNTAWMMTATRCLVRRMQRSKKLTMTGHTTL